MRKVVVMLVALVVGALIAGPAIAKKGGGKKTVFNIKLSGKAEKPKAGSKTGSGTAKLTVDAGKGQVCFKLTWSKIKDPTASHIHVGGKSTSGPVVVALFEGKAKHSGCVSASKSVLSAILKKPGGYYVNIHTPDFPAGAIRGQL
jgi:hypothetical protein